jgi:hypothetical protein
MPRVELPDTLEVGTLTGLSRDAVYIRNFLRQDDEAQMARTYLSFWDGSVFSLLRTFEYEICDIVQAGDGVLHVLGSAGQYDTFDGTDWVTLSQGFEPRARVSRIKICGSTTYALGTRGLIYRFEDRNGWQTLSTGMERSALRDLVLLADGRLAFCGTKGLFGIMDNNDQFLVEDLQTNANLFALLPQPDGILVMGARGTLFHYNNGERIDVGEGNPEVSFFNCVEFEDEVLISARTSIVKLSDHTLDVFRDGFSFKLRLIGDTLFNQEPDSVQVYGGDTWQDFPVWLDIPDNGSHIAQLK